MPLRWHIALSLAWGTVLGGILAVHTAALLLGLGWVYLYGDDPWPRNFTTWTVPVAAAVAGAFGFAAVAALAVWLRRTRPAVERRLAGSAPLRWALLAAPVVLMAIALWALQRQGAEAERARAEGEQLRQRQLEAHRLVSASWRLDSEAGRLRVEIAADGAAAGSYELRWAATGPGLSEPLGVGSDGRTLKAGPVTVILDLDASQLARRYAERILSRPEAVEIDLPLTVALALVPVGLGEAGGTLDLRVPLSYSYRPDGAIVFTSAQP
jgi:hypothetical protein